MIALEVMARETRWLALAELAAAVDEINAELAATTSERWALVRMRRQLLRMVDQLIGVAS